MTPRRGFLAGSAAIVPDPPHAPAHPDAALIALCNRHASLRDAFNGCGLDSDYSPAWPPYLASLRAITAARPVTVDGLAAKARAALAEATLPGGRIDFREGAAPRWIEAIMRGFLSGRITP